MKALSGALLTLAWLAHIVPCATPVCAKGPLPKIEFAAFLAPDTVIVGAQPNAMLCLVNRGEDGELRRGGVDDDHLLVRIPVGPGVSDLEADGAALACLPAADWDCSVELLPSVAKLTLGPLNQTVSVPSGATACFGLQGMRVNDTEGMTFSALEQFVHSKRALKPLSTRLPVFKTTLELRSHDDLGDVREEQHHSKTSRFAEMTDAATDAQVPDDITIDFASAAGDAATLDGVTKGALEESAEIDADVTGHAADSDDHHSRYTDDEARAAVAQGVAGYEFFRGDSQGGSLEVLCPAGKKVIGGGCDGGSDLVRETSPLPDGSGWKCRFDHDGFGWVICALVEF